MQAAILDTNSESYAAGLARAAGSLVMPLRICSCAVEGQNLLPPQLLSVRALRSITHGTWQNDKIRKLLSDSRGFPFNPTKQG